MKKIYLLLTLFTLILAACVPMPAGTMQRDGMHDDKMHDDKMHDDKMHDDMDGMMSFPQAIDLPGEMLYPEGIAIDGESIYVAGFISGEILKVDIMSGEASELVAAGADGVISGWGMTWDEANGLLIACANKNAFGQPPTALNMVRAIDPESGEVVESWMLPEGAICNAVALDNEGNIYMSNVGLAADVIKIDRMSGDVAIWSADERWPNDSGFGLAGAVFDGKNNIYVHFGGGVFRIPVNEDGRAGEAVMQAIVDADGNAMMLPGVDGLAWAGHDTLLTTNADFVNGGSEIVKLTLVDDDTLMAESIYDDLFYGASIAVYGKTALVTDAQLLTSLFAQAPPVLPFQVKTFAIWDMMDMHDGSEADEAMYNGPATEIAIRRLNADQDVDEFATLRDAFVDLLKAQPGANVDREFVPFVDFLTFAAPEPPVYIGMTEYTDMTAFQAASEALSGGPEAAAFFSTFNPEVFTVLRPLNAEDRYDLSTVATESGQVLEVAVRDLSSYENFVAADYEAARDVFLEALSQQEGWVQEMQWISLFDPNIVVGMTVYASAEAYQTIYSSEFVQAEATQIFAGNYPVTAGFASFDAR
ncbi:MAG: hypothetical protein AAF639_04040 [Chloroflexota bacterium]